MLHFGSCPLYVIEKEAVGFQGMSEEGGDKSFLSFFLFIFFYYFYFRSELFPKILGLQQTF